ncbi:MAG: cupredoxin domain-containing protein [Zoogloeaceae bacterium]|jgi:hypothetical protein|nr:cupredoxin domain-containing protein [Zoogloeaceae bacterium]
MMKTLLAFLFCVCSVAFATALVLFPVDARAADDMPTIKLLMKQGRLYPATLEVPANTRFRLEIHNEGPGAAEFESLELRKETVLAPGVTRTLVFHPLKPGSYSFFDDFHAETAQGRIVAK